MPPGADQLCNRKPTKGLPDAQPTPTATRWIAVIVTLAIISLAIPMLPTHAAPPTTTHQQNPPIQERNPDVPLPGFATPALLGVEWQWIAFEDTAQRNDITVPDPANYTLQFRPDGTFVMRVDCNIGSSTFTGSGSSLTSTPGPITLVACPDGSLDSTFLRLLPETTTFVLQEGILYLNLRVDSGTMLFQPAP